MAQREFVVVGGGLSDADLPVLVAEDPVGEPLLHRTLLCRRGGVPWSGVQSVRGPEIQPGVETVDRIGRDGSERIELRAD